MEDVKLFGFWPSPFSQRIIWALKLKGVSFEYIEEDLPHRKSEQLLEYNPVHKKIPVLVHGGKPIAESMVILEYIEDVWPQCPLLPKDPYERSTARFWAKFFDEQTRPMWEFFKKEGEELEKEVNKNLEILRIIEEHALKDKKFFGGDTIGIADIAFGWVIHFLIPMGDVVGVNFIKADTFPRLHNWKESFCELSVIKENLPDQDRNMKFFQNRRENFLKK